MLDIIRVWWRWKGSEIYSIAIYGDREHQLFIFLSLSCYFRHVISWHDWYMLKWRTVRRIMEFTDVYVAHGLRPTVLLHENGIKSLGLCGNFGATMSPRIPGINICKHRPIFKGIRMFCMLPVFVTTRTKKIPARSHWISQAHDAIASFKCRLWRFSSDSRVYPVQILNHSLIIRITLLTVPTPLLLFM